MHQNNTMHQKTLYWCIAPIECDTDIPVRRQAYVWKAEQPEKIAHNHGFAQRLDAPSHGTKSAYRVVKSYHSKIFLPTIQLPGAI
jgi:hypothetical protein